MPAPAVETQPVRKVTDFLLRKEDARNMNHKIKAILTVLLTVTLLICVTGCANEQDPYEKNTMDGYSVSVKYDANGGFFTTNTSVIVDSYDFSQLPADGNGDAQVALLAPEDSRRGNDAFTAIKSGHFLAGWYTERTETADGYVYSGRWDFENDRLTVAAGEGYSAGEPVVTLYAAWIPLFEIQFHDLDSGEYLASYTFDPNNAEEILVPNWDEETGAVEMYRFPERSGYTYAGAYYDAEGTQPVDTAALAHPGVVDYETGTAVDNSMKLYVAWDEGEWYHIYNVEQFLDNASVNGSYVIHADLDFEGEIWPTSLMYGNFSGTIQGNGHTFKNIAIEQTNNSKVNAGLFGRLAEGSSITDLRLENVTFTIKSGTRVAGTCYGLFAGSVSGDTTVENVTIRNSILQINSGCYFGVDDYSIGLVCGMGDAGIDASGITAQGCGDNPELVGISVLDDMVTVEFLTEEIVEE